MGQRAQERKGDYFLWAVKHLASRMLCGEDEPSSPLSPPMLHPPGHTKASLYHLHILLSKPLHQLCSQGEQLLVPFPGATLQPGTSLQHSYPQLSLTQFALSQGSETALPFLAVCCI